MRREYYLPLEAAPHILAETVFLNSEGDCGTPGKPTYFHVRSPHSLGEHHKMRNFHNSGDLNKILDHVLGADLDVAGCEGFHHLSEVTGQILHKFADFAPKISHGRCQIFP